MTGRRAVERRLARLEGRLADVGETVTGYVLTESDELEGPVTIPSRLAVAVELEGLDRPLLIPPPIADLPSALDSRMGIPGRSSWEG